MSVDKYQTSVQLFSKMYGNVPSFVDVFDEDSFYIFAGIVTVGSILVAIALSRFITIKESDF